MEEFTIKGKAQRRLGGSKQNDLVGVVASGNLEVLLERTETDADYSVEVSTASDGFREIWDAVIQEFVDRSSPGGLRISINDGGAMPDVVTLRLLQGVQMMEAEQ